MSDRERQVKRLVLTAVDECAVCGHEYELANVDVIGQRGEMWVLRLCCPRCRKQGFIAALVNGREPGPPAAFAELSDDDLRHDGRWTPITGRDVLELREFLDRFDGDFASAMSNEQ
jgi:hypothetical protein